jgi:hypothetical protein
VTRPAKISWIISDAWPSTPIPAVTFMHSTPTAICRSGGVVMSGAAQTSVVGQADVS